jgi:UDP-galactopyranose mutase
MKQSFSVIVFSHLRWNFVFQRPQHLLSRLSQWHHVVFIEEPYIDESAPPHWERQTPHPGVLVLRPHTPIASPGFCLDQLPTLRKLLREIEAEAGQDYVCWLYTPMALPLIEDLKPLAVVYDCMDELSAFLNAPPELLHHEARLLETADLVFTGGPSLYRSKKNRHPHVYCFPSSVDAAHFSQAGDAMPEAPDQAHLARPRLGFMGVIDERMDLKLLAHLAEAHSKWQIVMVGPVVKIDAASLPRAANLHYFGQRSYEELPSYLAGWDVCLLPFARNESTRFISPTKTLEYMAAHKMIVSTNITDVAEPYREIVYIADTHAQFIAGCEKALAISPKERAATLEGMCEVLSRTSWNKTAEDMCHLIAEVVGQRVARPARFATAIPETTQCETAIIGAGPTGLSAAYHLGPNTILLEKGNTVGGWCRSIEKDGFTFDYAGHIMFSNEPYVHQLYNMLLGDNVHWQDREAWIYSKNVYTRYPFQGALYGLPPRVIKECIVGAIEARFGALKAGKSPGSGMNGHANGHSLSHSNGKSNGSSRICTDVKDCCADGVLESTAQLTERNGSSSRTEPRNFEEFIYQVWGAGIAKHFAIPYNQKLWAVPLSEMETSWLGGRVPLPDLEEMIEGALCPVPKPMGPNARFGYPLRGGFQALMDGWLPYLGGKLRLNSRVTRVSPHEHTVNLSDGSQFRYEHLISTMPLPMLIRAMGEEAPEYIREAAGGLRHVSVRCVHLGVGREKLTEKHWIYYPEDTVFHRIFVQGNASPYCNPPGGFGLTCEITYSPHKPLPCEGDALVRRCIEDCHKVGIFHADDPVWTATQCDMPYAYVVYDHGRGARVAAIREWLSEYNIHLAGRYSEWEYYNSDHAFIAGKKAADEVKERQSKESAGLISDWGYAGQPAQQLN